jgi:sulfite dehydrogenase (cytochrome) subunit B
MPRTNSLSNLLALAAIALIVPASLGASPINYELPPETVAFKPGPNLDVVVNNCTACHSADYVATQPRGPKFKQEFWRAEVDKMIKVFGAPIAETDAAKIVEYLTATY